jgi:hypothetical protein
MMEKRTSPIQNNISTQNTRNPTDTGETTMFRKMTFALATVAALGAAALVPSSASAHGMGGGHWGGHGFGWGRVGIGLGVGLLSGAVVANTCLARRVFDTPYGPVVRVVNVCY